MSRPGASTAPPLLSPLSISPSSARTQSLDGDELAGAPLAGGPGGGGGQLGDGAVVEAAGGAARLEAGAALEGGHQEAAGRGAWCSREEEL